MGTQEGERNWVGVANNLLSRCNVNLTLSTLSECGPDVFVTLYETILGETVPDYIASANSQEDDVHNVQSVIDSLSLDYLQISLSHITGENVVSGDKESIKNLLEIFDGLLEYLSEELNEETQNDGTHEPNDPQNEDEADESKKPANLEAQQERRTSEGTGSANELKGSDQTLTAKQQEPSVRPLTSGAVDVEGAPHQDQMFSAIPLQPPSQRDTPHAAGRPLRAASLSQGSTEETNPDITRVEDSKVTTETLTNGIMSSMHRLSSGKSDDSASTGRRTAAEMEGETLEPTNGGPRRVLFRPQPDVLFLTLQDEVSAIRPSPPDTDEDGEVLSCVQRLKDQGTSLRTRTDETVPESSEESLAYRRKRNKKVEEELHHISENLSHRLEELDLMLKRLLGESDESHSSCSSGSVKRTCRNHREKPDPDKLKASHSPRRKGRSTRSQLEEARVEALSLDDRKQTSLQVPHHSKRGESHRRSSQWKHLESDAYEEELRRWEERERTELQIARRGAQKAEREYREAILRDGSPSPKTKTQQKTQRAAQRRVEVPRKTPSLRIRENELLPLLREELPYLHVSPHALGRMWEQQMQQVDKLHAVSSSPYVHPHKLSKQLKEAQRKHDLLVDLVYKDQNHNRRLREFKERIQQQKSVQSKLREQRQQIAWAKKYHNDYHVQHRARLMRARTKEEKMFRQLFEEGLELQKLLLREQRAYAKEKQLEHQRQQQDQIESLENYYKDQFSLLAEKLANEREEIQVRKKAQEKALVKMKRELRSRMEREIRDLQKIIIQNDEDDHFQNLEVQRLRNQVHMASFQYNTSYLH